MHVLIAEDEPKLARHIAVALAQAGHATEQVSDGNTALQRGTTGHFDLILLDVNLPGRDGFNVLAALRAAHVPTRVLILTAHGEIGDRVRGLELGADDYLAKPFAMAELLARVHALGRRFPAEPQALLRVGDLTLDLGTHKAQRGGRPIDLSAREFTLLRLLMREPGRVFTRTELCELVWERDHAYDTKLVEVFIGRLRRKVDVRPAPPLIHTIRHEGYKIAAP
jgi:two-component system OmpR family response regulator/two-component system copper resistance phosphate regulon response regulator CusR